ncbi:MAG TPA: Tim44-like domain-containing protein [Gallionellaceae bacterium]|nr:Tim44-like domain-containing protein [Gallionellaceae bacterium]
MKRFLLVLTIALSSITLLAANAEARRLGGGSSIGKQRTMSPQQTQKAPVGAPAAAPSAAPAAGNKWLGPLAGLAIGAGLGALFMGGGLGGMGGAMGSILMALAAAALVIFLIAKFRKPQQPAMQYAGQGAPYPQPEAQTYAGGSAAAPAVKNIPADFPVEAFLRSAKMSFIRLQAANDRKDLNDIREYTTPEMYAEISMQLQERGSAAQTTDVIAVNADLLEVVTENNHAIASVRMTGQLSENKGAAENFDEIWHVQKNLQDDKAVWLLSGIQQIA